MSLCILLVVALSGLFTLLAWGTPAASAAVPINRNRIKNVIYPTFGFPSITRCGDTLTVEFDPRDQNWSAPLPTLTDFTASLTTSNSNYPVTEKLQLQDFGTGFSTHWPEYSQAAQPKAQVYLVTFKIPEDVPLDLWDLTVQGQNQDGSWMTDMQPHAVQTVIQYKDDYTYSQLSDIHVWGPEVNYPGSTIHERNYRLANYSETDGYGATYYHKEIQQVNVEKPDFAVYTGDYDFSQKWLYQENYADFSQYASSPWNGKYYEPAFEMDWFYQETMKLDVPVFITLGNHDAYARYDFWNTKLEEDYMATWRNLFGPQYFSYDYGPDHFTSVNTMDWTSSQRNLHWVIPNVILNPGKWQGEIEGGGDSFEAGWTQARENAINESNFTGQLLWLKKDLEAHASSRMRTIAVHTDPWKLNGSGSMFDDASMFGIIKLGGKGDGRLAFIKLARENNVALMLSGHDHSDCYGTIPWTAGGGEVKFVNTTATMFQDAPNTLSPDWTRMWVYPGYRSIHVASGSVVNFYYKLANDEAGQPLQYSWPFYAGTNVGGETNFANLTAPAVGSAWSTQPGTVQDVTCTLTNTLTGYQVSPGGPWSGDVSSAFMKFPMPYLSGGYYYQVSNGTFGDIYDNSDTSPDHRIYQVYADLQHAPGEATPTVLPVSVNKSASPDLSPPSCTTFQINGGAPTTDVADVTLTNNTTDAESGMLDMMISNDDPTFAGAEWQRFEGSTSWALIKQGGLRTVYIKFRDRAMPGNVSAPISASIVLVGNPPAITGVSPPAAGVGDTVTINGTDFGAPRTAYDKVRFNGIMAAVTSWQDTQIQCVVPYGACTGVLTVSNDAGNATEDFSVVPGIDSITPDGAFNTGPVQITNLNGTGFFAQGSHPVVKLNDGTTDIVATDVQVISAQSITCQFDLTGAPVGPRNVIVENADGYSATLSGGFNIDYPPPTLSGITPNSGVNDGPVAITDLAGMGFRDGIQVSLVTATSQIEATGVALVSPEKLTCDFDLRGAAAGPWDVMVENTDGETAVLWGAFTVQNPPTAPRVDSLTPAESAPGGVVTIKGDQFGASQGTSYVTFAGVPSTGYRSWSDNQVAAVVPPGAASGPVQVFTHLGASNSDKQLTVLSPTWYVAEGSTAHGYSTYLSIENPNAAELSARVTYMMSGGPTMVQTVGLPAQGQVTLNPADLVGSQDFSTKVECLQGKTIAVDRTMLWTGPGAASPEAHASIGVTAPSDAWYMPEGSSSWGFETWLLVQNPNNKAANCTVTYMIEGKGPKTLKRVVPANSRASYGMADDIGAADASIQVQSDAPVVCERSMYRNNRREGSNSVGATAPSKTFFLAEGSTAWGFSTYVLVQNPNPTNATITMSYMTPAGEKQQAPFVMGPDSRETVFVNAVMPGTDLSTRVTADVPVIAERAMYWGSGSQLGEACHDSIGIPQPHSTFYLPDGQTSSGRQTYILVQNPNNSPVKAEITYLAADGKYHLSHGLTIPANSRMTEDMSQFVPSGRASIVVTSMTAGKKIISERSMYWNNRGVGTETIGGFSDTVE